MASSAVEAIWKFFLELPQNLLNFLLQAFWNPRSSSLSVLCAFFRLFYVGSDFFFWWANLPFHLFVVFSRLSFDCCSRASIIRCGSHLEVLFTVSLKYFEFPLQAFQEPLFLITISFLCTFLSLFCVGSNPFFWQANLPLHPSFNFFQDYSFDCCSRASNLVFLLPLGISI